MTAGFSDHEPEAAGFVLAGGQSSRMGQDKALVELGGQALITRALRLLCESNLTASIAGAHSDLSAFGRVIADAGRGPLGGICAALESTEAEYSVFISVDMPLLPATLLVFLLESAQRTQSGAALASAGGFAQTFPVVIHRSLLPGLRAELEQGSGGCFTAFRNAADQSNRPMRVLGIENLVQAGQIEDPSGLPAAYWFLNVNSPVDLARAESLLTLCHRVS